MRFNYGDSPGTNSLKEGISMYRISLTPRANKQLDNPMIVFEAGGTRGQPEHWSIL